MSHSIWGCECWPLPVCYIMTVHAARKVSLGIWETLQDTEAKTQHPAESTGSHEPERTHSARMDVLQLSVNCISQGGLFLLFVWKLVFFLINMPEAFRQDVYEKWERIDPRGLSFFGVPGCQDQKLMSSIIRWNKVITTKLMIKGIFRLHDNKDKPQKGTQTKLGYDHKNQWYLNKTGVFLWSSDWVSLHPSTC